MSVTSLAMGPSRKEKKKIIVPGYGDGQKDRRDM